LIWIKNVFTVLMNDIIIITIVLKPVRRFWWIPLDALRFNSSSRLNSSNLIFEVKFNLWNCYILHVLFPLPLSFTLPKHFMLPPNHYLLNVVHVCPNLSSLHVSPHVTPIRYVATDSFVVNFTIWQRRQL